MTGRCRWSRARVPDQDSRYQPPRGPRPAPGPRRPMGTQLPQPPQWRGAPHPCRGEIRGAAGLARGGGDKSPDVPPATGTGCLQPGGHGKSGGAPPAARRRVSAPQQPPWSSPPTPSSRGAVSSRVAARGRGFGEQGDPKAVPGGGMGAVSPLPEGLGCQSCSMGAGRSSKSSLGSVHPGMGRACGRGAGGGGWAALGGLGVPVAGVRVVLVGGGVPVTARGPTCHRRSAGPYDGPRRCPRGAGRR